MFSSKDCEQNEILRIPHQNYENHEKLNISLENNENHEIQTIPKQNYENHEKNNYSTFE